MRQATILAHPSECELAFADLASLLQSWQDLLGRAGVSPPTDNAQSVLPAPFDAPHAWAHREGRTLLVWLQAISAVDAVIRSSVDKLPSAEALEASWQAIQVSGRALATRESRRTAVASLETQARAVFLG